MSVYDKHSDEIARYQVRSGRDKGRLVVAGILLSDVRSLLVCANWHSEVQKLEHAWELISDVISDLE